MNECFQVSTRSETAARNNPRLHTPVWGSPAEFFWSMKHKAFMQLMSSEEYGTENVSLCPESVTSNNLNYMKKPRLVRKTWFTQRGEINNILGIHLRIVASLL